MVILIRRQGSEGFMAKASKKVIEALTAIPGVGEATAKKLAAAGMSSKSDVVKAGIKGLKAAGITAGTAAKIAKAVASSKAKAATKKAKAVTKKATSKKTTPAPTTKSKVSTEESGVRGDQVGTKIAAPKSVADMLKRVNRSN
jgi:ribosomal protein S13